MTTDKPTVSSCCAGTVDVAHGDEGTNYHVCRTCGKACDSVADCSLSYFPGAGCTCSAYDASECGCPGVDWTPSELHALRKAVEEVRQRLYELPELVLANEKKNPAWSKLEMWAIERDIIPSIRALCLSAAHLLPENA